MRRTQTLSRPICWPLQPSLASCLRSSMNSDWGLTRTLGVMVRNRRGRLCCPLPREWFNHWSLRSGQGLRCLSKHSKRLLPRASQNLLHIQRQLARSILPSSLCKVRYQYMCAPSHGIFLYPVSSCLVGDYRGLARTRGPCSQDAFTLDAAILAESRTCWHKWKGGSCCGYDTTNHVPIDAVSSQASTILPPLHFPKWSCHLSSVTPELYATCFAHYPEPMPIKRPHVQHERPSAVTLAMDSRLSCV